MKVHVVVCQRWLREECSVLVIGVYRSRRRANQALGEDEISNHLGAHLAREVVEVDLGE